MSLKRNHRKGHRVSGGKKRQARGKFIEGLESRRLLSAVLDVNGVLLITGSDLNDTISIIAKGDNYIVKVSREPTQTFVRNSVVQFTVNAGDGHDKIMLPLGDGAAPAVVNADGGNDKIYSGGGNDSLRGGTGDDIYYFADDWGVDQLTENDGEGNDTADFSKVTGNLAFNLGQLIVLGAADSLNHGEDNVENLIGGNGDDAFRFPAAVSHNGTIDGGRGFNGLNYADFGSAVNVDLSQGTATSVTSFKGVNEVIGSVGNDTITGSNGADSLRGGPGNDIINGGSGNDSLFGGADDDTLDGGNGVDAMSGGDGNDSYGLDPSGKDTMDEPLGAGSTLDLSGNKAKLRFYIKADGSLTVNVGRKVLATGTTEMARLVGGKSHDYFIFEDGATFDGILDGGLGKNRLDFSAYTTDLNVDLSTGAASPVDAGQAGRVFNMMYLIGGSGNDTLSGDDLANYIYGNAGNDTLSGLGGRDYLRGGAGDDDITGGADIDKFFGDDGNDIFHSEDSLKEKINGGKGDADDASDRDLVDSVSGVEVLAG